jgi:hypothetical protein
VRVAHRRAVDVDAGRATVDDRFHAVVLSGTQSSEQRAPRAPVARDTAEPADDWVTAICGAVEVAETA